MIGAAYLIVCLTLRLRKGLTDLDSIVPKIRADLARDGVGFRGGIACMTNERNDQP